MEHFVRQLEVVDDVMVELSRQKTPAELTIMASRMFAASRERLRSYLREQHPEWTGEQLQEELRRRIHGSA